MSTPTSDCTTKPGKTSLWERAMQYLFTRRYVLSAVLIFVVSFATYYHTLKGGFVWDDSILLAHYMYDDSIYDTIKQEFLPNPWHVNYCYYRPVAAISFITDNRLWGPDPFGYRLTNLLTHSLVCVLVFIVALGWLGSLSAALIAGLLFCFIPAHNETVAWVCARCDLFFTLFLLLAYLCYTRRMHSKRARIANFILTPAFYALALFSKEAGLIFLPLAVIDDWARKRQWSIRGVLIDYLPLVASTAVYFGVRRWAIGTISPGNIGPAVLPDRLMDWPANVLAYLDMIVWPHVPYPFVLKQHIAPEHMSFYFAGVALFVYLIIRLRNISRRGVFLAAWLLIPLLVISDVIPFMGHVLCMRSTYPATIAYCAICGAAGAWLLKRAKGAGPRMAVGGVVLAVMLAFAWFTVTSTGTWQSNHSMYECVREHHKKESGISSLLQSSPRRPQGR